MGVLNAIQYVTNPQLSTDDQSNPYALQQRQQLINALKQQAMNPAQLQNAGPVVPRESFITPLVQALQGYTAGRMQNSQDIAMQGLANKKSSASQALIQSLYGQQQQSSPQQAPDPAQQGPQASQMPSPVASMFNSPQQSQQVPQPSQQTAPQQSMAAPQQQDPYAAARQKIAVIAQGIQSGTIDPELGKQLLTQAQKDATPAKDYTLGDNRFSGRTNQMIAQAPSGDATKPSDELAKLSQDLKNGFITQSDYNARRNLMTTRAPNAYTVLPGNGNQDDGIVQSWAQNVLNGNATMQQVPMAHRDNVSQYITNMPSDAYSPLASSRFSTAANRIATNYINLPQYQLTANGMPYLQRIDAALKKPGSVSDEDLLDSLIKLNTGGNAVTEAQVNLITHGKSFSDTINTMGNKLQNGGVLSDSQRKDIADLSKSIYDNYRKGYQPVYDQVAKQLNASGIPKAFWGIPDLNNLSEQAGLGSIPGSNAPTAKTQSGATVSNW